MDSSRVMNDALLASDAERYMSILLSFAEDVMQQGITLAGQTFLEVVQDADIGKELLDLLDILAGEMNIIRRYEGVKIATKKLVDKEGAIARYPVLTYQLLLSWTDVHEAKQIKKALALNPISPRLLTYLASPMSCFGFSNYFRRLTTVRQSRQSTIFNGLPEFVFTPLLEISIGHNYRMTDVFYNCLERGGMPEDVVFYTYDANKHNVLAKFLSMKYGFNLILKPYQSLLRQNFESVCRSHIYTNEYIEYIIDQGLKPKADRRVYASCRTRLVVIHLRTSAYKNDGHSVHACVRNVSPISYKKAIDNLREQGYSPILITADNSNDLRCLDSKIFRVTNDNDILRQYKMIEECDFMIGTGSGISALSTLGNARILITNSTSLWTRQYLSDKHLFAMKKLRLTKQMGKSFIDNLARFIEPWEFPDGLMYYSSIHDLESDELATAVQEFLDLLNGASTYSLHGLLEKHNIRNLKPLVQDRNLTSYSFRQLDALLLHIRKCK